ncbi:hypothetical protein L3X38_004641 [Prunus dulcis]|uniref:Reverse transcriptase domain-containing protein n=1 Tax=Prunus dulcis TaxID=3755 RepID=A0AAD4ZPD8_PRUDU|nr:hypothetical protein L3X38_004641 [Prunus dulcis]
MAGKFRDGEKGHRRVANVPRLYRSQQGLPEGQLSVTTDRPACGRHCRPRTAQIFMHPPDSEHTAFITDKGLYCYNVMPFGLKNAGATYQRLVNKIFAGYIGNIMEVYVDDMLVKSRTAEEHLQNLSIMFGILKDYRMRLNPKKCAFGVSSREIPRIHDQSKGDRSESRKKKSNHRYGEAEDDEGHSKPYRTRGHLDPLHIEGYR